MMGMERWKYIGYIYNQTFTNEVNVGNFNPSEVDIPLNILVMFKIKHLQMNQMLAFNNPLEVYMPLNK